MMKWLWKILYRWNLHRAKSLEVEKFKQCDICIKKRLKIANNYYKRF